MSFESDPRAFDEDHAIRAVVLGGISVVGFVQLAEVLGYANAFTPFSMSTSTRGSHTPFSPSPYEPVVIEVAELADECAFSNAGAADYCNAH